MDVVLIDFDGTITQRDTTRVLVFALLRARPWRLFRVLGPLLRLVVGGDEEQIQRAKDRCVGALLRGLSEAQLQPSLLRYRKGVLPLIRPELVALMRERAENGGQVLVVTASAEPAVREALRDFSVAVLGTRFRVLGGRFTGDVEGEGCYGAAKVPRIGAWAGAQPAQPRYLEAWSDSLTDLPMLKLAEKRVWVCRERQVERIRERDPQGEIVQVGGGRGQEPIVLGR